MRMSRGWRWRGKISIGNEGRGTERIRVSCAHPSSLVRSCSLPTRRPPSLMPSPTRPFEQTVDVETPELVVLTYSVAGVGSRVLAAFTDLLICLAAMVALVFL